MDPDEKLLTKPIRSGERALRRLGKRLVLCRLLQTVFDSFMTFGARGKFLPFHHRHFFGMLDMVNDRVNTGCLACLASPWH